MKKNKVLVVAPGRATRGGITSVVKSYENSEIWIKWNCKWIETYKDSNALIKIYFFLKSFFIFSVNLPSATIVHIHLSETTSAIRKSFFFFLAYLFRKKIIVHFHAFSPATTIHGNYKKLYKYLFIKSDKVFVLSKYWKDEIDLAFGHNTINTVVVFNPCNVIDRDETNIPKEKIILFAGTLNERKGFVDLIKAFAIVLKTNPEWKLVLAGNGEIERGKTLAAELGVLQSILFTGWISGIDKDTFFRKSSIFCLPSYNEGFPMAILDAIAYGLPIVTTPVGGILDVFTDNKNAFIFNPGDINSLAQKLITLIDNKDVQEQFKVSSIKLATTSFAFTSISNQVDALYTEVLN